jgi:hypothetical protein
MSKLLPERILGVAAAGFLALCVAGATAPSVLAEEPAQECSQNARLRR